MVNFLRSASLLLSALSGLARASLQIVPGATWTAVNNAYSLDSLFP